MMLTKILSGGQTGADQGGWRAAMRFGIDVGGWMPKGFKTEDGFHPEYRELFNAREHWHPDYPARTAANIYDADGTVIFTNDPNSPGTLLAGRVCLTNHRPLMTVTPRGVWRHPRSLVNFIKRHDISALNVAGNRESSFPDCSHWVNLYLGFTLKRLGFVEQVPLEERSRRGRVSLYTPSRQTTNRLHEPPKDQVRPAKRSRQESPLYRKPDASPKPIVPSITPPAARPPARPMITATYSYRGKPGKKGFGPKPAREPRPSFDPNAVPPWVE